MKHFVLFFAVFIALFFHTNCYSADSSLLSSSSSLQPEASIGSSGDTSHYLILANGMPPSETPEPQPPKDLPPKDLPPKDRPPKAVIEPLEDDEEFLDEEETINDPLEGYNRVVFKFNDKLYFYCLKPIARGYRAVLPKRARTSVRNFFSNAAMPARFINCTLQGKIKGVATETARFFLNTTLGIGGFFDPAQSFFNLKEQGVDLDQTLGIYGMGPVIFINWPLLGVSSLRGTLGLIGDTAFDPTTYLLSPLIKIGIATYEEVNETSLTIGEYEALTESALDPYIAVRNAYFQNRKSKIKPEKAFMSPSSPRTSDTAQLLREELQ